MKFLALMITLLMLTVSCEDQAAAPAERSAPTDNGEFGDLEDGGGETDVQPTEPVQGCGSNEGATFNGLSCEEAKSQYDKSVKDCIESGKFFDAKDQKCTDTDLSSEECTVDSIRAKYDGGLDTFDTLISGDYMILACLENSNGFMEYFVYKAAAVNPEGKIATRMLCTVIGTEDKAPKYSGTCQAN